MSGPRKTVRTRLFELVLACVLPLCLFAAGIGYRVVLSHEDALKAAVVERLRVATQDLDERIAEAETMLETIAASEALEARAFAIFRAEIARVARSRGIGIVLAGLDGRAILWTPAPGADPSEPDWAAGLLRQAAATGVAVVSDLRTGAASKRGELAVGVPVRVGDEVAFAIAMIFPVESLGEVLASQSLPAEWVVGVADRRHVILARSREAARFVGTPTAFTARLRDPAAPVGEWTRSRDFEGRPVLSTFVRSDRTGWSTYVAIPEGALNAPLRATVGAMAAAGALALLIGGTLAYRLARGISDPLRWFGRIAAGETSAPPPDTRIAEIDHAIRLVAARERQRDEAMARLRTTWESAAAGIAEVDGDGRYIDVNQALCRITGYGRAELLTLAFTDVVHPDDLPAAIAAHRGQVEGRLAELSGEYRYLRKDGRTTWISISGSAVRDEDGRFLYGVRVVQDVTSRREAEERQRLLTAELNHRVKNTLATVRSLARRTLTGAPSLPAFSERFEARLKALADTHALLTAASWAGADLRSLCAQELAPYAAIPGDRCTLDGPAVSLRPRAALTLGLALHELATNAAKYGALSSPAGRVAVSWRAETRDGRGWLLLDWAESDGPPVRTPQARGFGLRLIERGIAHELGGRADLDFAPDGLRCRLEFPLGPDARPEDLPPVA